MAHTVERSSTGSKRSLQNKLPITLSALIVRRNNTIEIAYGLSPERIKAALHKTDHVWTYKETGNAAVFNEHTVETALQRSQQRNKYMEWKHHGHYS